MSPVSDVSHAQNLEDVRLWRVLYDCPDKFFVDCGANHPTKCSVTKWFSERGWSGINIEPGPTYTELALDRSNEINLNIAIGAVEGERNLIVPVLNNERASFIYENAYDESIGSSGNETILKVNVRRLDRVLEECAASQGISFMSIDAEGSEEETLASNDWNRFRPRILMIEAINPITMLPNFKEWEEIITHNNYQYAMFDGINNFYVSDESCHLFDRLAFDLTGRFAMQNKESSIQIEAIKNSWAYRIGNLILTPMRAFKGAVKQIINLFIKK